ncbi:HupE/UreJ family protein [Aquincola sp. MAHUQ-54]|uniref:HupE/UreJ family protein n=1 Tax=Aquincola agrisoli TaxID=3119538 RepID=A0AAW9QD01_9BURK
MTFRPSPAGRAGLAALAAALPLAAAAHVGADGAAHHGFASGWLHPFTGIDHLVAMLAVGVWSAVSAPRVGGMAYARGPLAFAALLLAGSLLGAAGLALPAVEPMIAASLLVLGLLVALRPSLPPAAGVALVGVFALFHGGAHGVELSGVAALAGMVLATALLHAAGLAIGHAARTRSVWFTRLAGGAATLFGAGLFFT